MPLDALQDVLTEALLVLYANGDPAAARALTLRLTPRAYGLAFRMLGRSTAPSTWPRYREGLGREGFREIDGGKLYGCSGMLLYKSR